MASYDPKAILGDQLETLATEIFTDIRQTSLLWDGHVYNSSGRSVWFRIARVTVQQDSGGTASIGAKFLVSCSKYNGDTDNLMIVELDARKNASAGDYSIRTLDVFSLYDVDTSKVNFCATYTISSSQHIVDLWVYVKNEYIGLSLSALAPNYSGTTNKSYFTFYETSNCGTDGQTSKPTNDKLKDATFKRVQTSSDLVSSWQTTPDNKHIPSEKLVRDGLDAKVDIANIDLTSVNTTILSQVQQMAGAGIHYRRFFTTSNGGADYISDKPVSGAGFLVVAYCDRRVSSSDWRYVLLGYSQDHKPYFASVSHESTSISWTQLFSWDHVMTSSDTSSWSSDNSNVPTRAAVEAKISSAMSGQLGGFLGTTTVQVVNNAIWNGLSFKKGDWFAITGAGGTINYYVNNDRSQGTTALAVQEGDSVYWTSDGHLVVKPNTSLLVYDINSQSGFSNWNDLTSPGLYQISVGGVTNAPAAGAFSCLVSNVNGNIRQVAMQSNNIYYRGKGSQSGWTSWRNVNDVDHATSADNADTATNSTHASSADSANSAVYAQNYSPTGTIISALNSKLTTNGIYDAAATTAWYAAACSPVIVIWAEDSTYTDIEGIINSVVSSSYRNTNVSGNFRRLWLILNASPSDRYITGFYNNMSFRLNGYCAMLVVQTATNFFRMN